eukprot:sb/3474799/
MLNLRNPQEPLSPVFTAHFNYIAPSSDLHDSFKYTVVSSVCLQCQVQSDPDLVISSGERVLGTKSGWALNRGQITLIFLNRGKFILSLNRGVTKSGVTISGSDCIYVSVKHDLSVLQCVGNRNRPNQYWPLIG